LPGRNVCLGYKFVSEGSPIPLISSTCYWSQYGNNSYLFRLQHPGWRCDDEYWKNDESKVYYHKCFFCEGPYSGNQWATVIEVDGLSGEEMQKIVLEFNFSGTTFVCGGNLANGFDVW